MIVRQTLYDSDGNSDNGGSSNIESGTRAGSRGRNYGDFDARDDSPF